MPENGDSRAEVKVKDVLSLRWVAALLGAEVAINDWNMEVTGGDEVVATVRDKVGVWVISCAAAAGEDAVVIIPGTPRSKAKGRAGSAASADWMLFTGTGVTLLQGSGVGGRNPVGLKMSWHEGTD